MANLHGVKIIHNDCFKDNRGELWTMYKSDQIENIFFNHDKVAFSEKNVLRGLHTDKSFKLVTCLSGKIQFVVVNYISSSSEYLKYQSFILDSSDELKTSILVPPGFLNGHLVLSEKALFHYKWSYNGDYPDTDNQVSIRWSDPTLDIQWMSDNPILSDRDSKSKFIN